MNPLDHSVLALLGRQYFVASRSQLLLLGLSRHQIEQLVHRQQLAVVHRGVYRLASAPESLKAQALGATLADDEIAVSHQSAGSLWGLRQMASPFVHVTSAHGRHPVASPHVKVHRSNVLRPQHIRTLADGTRLTSPARTLFDLSGVVGIERLESAVEHALRLRLATVPELWEVTRDLARKGRAGSGRFVTLLNSRPATLKPVDSDLELRLERALMAAGLPRPSRQFAIRLRNGHTLHPDLVWADARLAVEVDHVTWHGGRVAIVDDRSRDRQLRMLRWDVERVTDAEVTSRCAAVVRDLVDLYHHRCATNAA